MNRHLSFPPLVQRFLHPSEHTLLLGLAIMVGLATGVGVWLFDQGIEFFHVIFSEKIAHDLLGPWLGPLGVIISLALAGLIVGWLMQRFVGQERHHGLSGIIEAVALAGGRLRYSVMPVKSLAAALSLGAGASVGPEAPSVVIGANIGSFFGQRLRLSEERMRLLVAAGAASAIAAAFHAPIAGVFFALEVILNGEFTTSSFGVVVLAAVIGSVFMQAVTQGGPVLGSLNFTLGAPVEILFYALLGLLLAPVAVLFIHVVHWQHHVWHRLRLTPILKPVLAGGLVGIVALFLPQIMGTGREVMAQVFTTSDTAFTVQLLLALAFAKLLMTGVSIAGGFVGGIFAPTLFVGTMLGGAFGRLVITLLPESISGSPEAYAIAGMAAMMAGVVRAPITAILLVFELTNDYHLILPIMFTTVICVYLTERLVPGGIDILPLLKSGLRLQPGREVDVMQGITVQEAMSPALTIAENASLLELRDRLRQTHSRALCVVDKHGLLSGIVTLTDLQRAYEAEAQAALKVRDICTRKVITITPTEVLWSAIRSLNMGDIASLPVVKPGTRELVGMLNRQRVVQAYQTAITQKREQHHRIEQIRLNTLAGAHVFEFRVETDSPASGQYIRDVPWPAESVVASIRRKNKLILPHGNTRLEAGDVLTLVAEPEAAADLEALFEKTNANAG